MAFTDERSARRFERRYAYMERVRKKARVRAEKRYEGQFSTWVHPDDRVLEGEREWSWYYNGAMRGQGHWVEGGCHRVQCGLCQPRGLKPRDLRELERSRQEIWDWEHGIESAEKT